MAKRNTFQEEKDFNELISVNSEMEIEKLKKEISLLLPNDIKIIAKNESQKKLINSIRNNEITICAGPAGSGKTFVSLAYALSLLRKTSNKFKKIYLVKSVTTLKGEEIGFLKGPQPYYEKVLTPSGFTTMGDLQINDYVISENGDSIRITDIHEKGVKDVYRLYLKDGRFVDCCLDHYWNVRTKKIGYFTVNTKFLIDYIKKEDFYLPQIKPVKYSVNNNLKIHPYLLGVLIGDGCFTHSHIRYSNIDNELIEKIDKICDDLNLRTVKNNISYNIISKDKLVQRGSKEIKLTNLISNEVFTGFLKDVKEYLNFNNNSTIIKRCINNSIVNNIKYEYTDKISKSNNLLREYLHECKLFGKKSWEKFIPQEYKFSSIENRLELLRGLLDTDGTIKKNGEITYTTTSIKLAEDIKEIVLSLGGSARIYEPKFIKRNQILNGDVVIQRRQTYTVYIKFHNNNINPFYIKRKSERFKPLNDYSLKIVKIENIGIKEKMRCISVDSETSLYLTNNFIATHNSLEEKIEPFMWSFYINMEKLIISSSIKSLIEKEIIRPFPLAYMRGASLDDCIIIADECVSGENKIIIHNPNNNEKRKIIKIKKLPHYFNKCENLMVLSHNDKIHSCEWKKINSFRITKNKKTIKIKTRENKNCIITTENHPFGIIENGIIKYVPAMELKVGDRILKRKNKKGNHSILNENNYDVLLGFLIGDGCLQKNKQWDNNIFRLRKQHSLKQLEYNEFCAELYGVKCNNTGKSGFTDDVMSTFNTKSYYINNDFIERLFPNGSKKRITTGIEKYMTIRTLAIWFMDDGSNYIYNEDGSNIRLHTEGLTKKENYNLQTILKNKFNIVCDVETTKRQRKDRIGEYNYYFNLKLNNENSLKFQELIKNYVHPSMEYKLNKKYRGFYLHDNYLKYFNYSDITTSIIENICDNKNDVVYNIEVEDNNNYFVNDILTHNCQNVTLDNSRTLLTRIGSNSKLILLGDINQIDMKNKEESSLEVLLSLFDGVSNMGVIHMSEEDTNVRNPLISVIESKYKEYINKKINGNNKKQQLNS